jgi:hypothetical protein
MIKPGSIPGDTAMLQTKTTPSTFPILLLLYRSEGKWPEQIRSVEGCWYAVRDYIITELKEKIVERNSSLNLCVYMYYSLNFSIYLISIYMYTH